MSHATRPTAAPRSIEIERGAFNAAFYELGLRWYWDPETYDALATVADDGSRLRHYIETQQSHLLSAYDPEFLTKAILAAKTRCQQMDASCAPRSMQHIDWTQPRSAEIGV
ncbi:MAG: hypothetical protein M3Y32_03495 [Pseudomonadota bacterium]|nr:hypothetical protein [Pseudomonadota bacterium]